MRTYLRGSFALLLFGALIAGCGGPPTEVPTPAPSATAVPTPAPSPTAVPTPVPLYTATPLPQIDTPNWFGESVLYEIFVRSYYDSDGNGIGDLAGITSRLDYVSGLGAGAVWLMPIHPSPSYHGYDVTDYYAVNPDYGTREDLVALVDAAHRRGIRVILDLVINHTSDRHPFFAGAWGNPDSEYSDWYLWSNADHTAYQSFGGYKTMPKLNHANPAVVAYAIDVARYWMDLDGDGDYADGVDGFRCDVAREVPLTTWQALRAEMRRWNPESLLLGEVWDTNARNLVQWYDGAFDALFNFPLYSDLSGSNDQSQDSLLAGLQRPDMVTYTLLGEDRLLPPGYQMVQFASNHDTNRVMSDVGSDWARARSAATLVLTLPGTPMIYYGEEIGMKGEKGKGSPFWDEYRREPMDWYTAESGLGMTSWFKPESRFNRPDDAASVEEQAGVPGSLLEHYRALVSLRQAHRALVEGAFAPLQVSGSDSVYAFLRHAPANDSSPEELCLVVLNFSGDPQSVGLQLDPPIAATWAVRDALTGTAWPDVPVDAPYAVELPPSSGFVLLLSRP